MNLQQSEIQVCFRRAQDGALGSARTVSLRRVLGQFLHFFLIDVAFEGPHGEKAWIQMNLTGQRRLGGGGLRVFFLSLVDHALVGILVWNLEPYLATLFRGTRVLSLQRRFARQGHVFCVARGARLHCRLAVQAFSRESVRREYELLRCVGLQPAWRAVEILLKLVVHHILKVLLRLRPVCYGLTRLIQGFRRDGAGATNLLASGGQFELRAFVVKQHLAFEARVHGARAFAFDRGRTERHSHLVFGRVRQGLLAGFDCDVLNLEILFADGRLVKRVYAQPTAIVALGHSKWGQSAIGFAAAAAVVELTANCFVRENYAPQHLYALHHFAWRAVTGRSKFRGIGAAAEQANAHLLQLVVVSEGTLSHHQFKF